MSTHVVGFQLRDENWERHEVVWKACCAAQVSIPPETLLFFGHEDPIDKPGREVDIRSAVQRMVRAGSEGYDVDITKLPKNVTVVRFYNSW
jgi:hypothetical protein